MEEKKLWKKCFIEICIFTAVLFIAVIVLVYVIDPFFHYHAPMEGWSYVLGNERYQNDGIARNFDYNAAITGTSMTQNFRTSMADELWGKKFIKISYAGSYFKEISDSTERMLSYNPDVDTVVCSIEMAFITYDKDMESPGITQPEYLYDNNIVNDIKYIFNRDVLFYYIPESLSRTVKGVPADDFDSYSRFAEVRPTGSEYVLANLPRPEVILDPVEMSTEEWEGVKGNVEQNLLANVKANPDVDFYFFIPPYSGYNWYVCYVAQGKLKGYVDSMRYVAGELLKYDNVHLFCFYDDTEMVMNLDNYSDDCHFSGEISDMILTEMAKDDSCHELTIENYTGYFDNIEEFYGNYDYEGNY